MVTDHIPKVIASHECSTETTATIRFFLDEAKGSSQAVKKKNQRRARVRVWMITPRLQALFKLTEPSEFWRLYWDTVRCHYLLWKIGIAHGDISLTNLMYTEKNGQLVGILNDYDLAVIMEPGARFPEKSGCERTATIAFMALDLLSYTDGQLQRWYRHDLESFSWCLLWRMLKDPPIDWLYKSFGEVEASKRSFIDSMDKHTGEFKHTWALFSTFMVDWAERMGDYSNSLSKLVTRTLVKNNNFNAPDSYKLQIRNAEDQRREESYHIKFVTDAAKEVTCGVSIPALEDVSWIDVVLLTSPE